MFSSSLPVILAPPLGPQRLSQYPATKELIPGTLGHPENQMPSVFLKGLQYQNLELKKIGHENSIVPRGRNPYFIGKIMDNLMILALLYKRVLELYYVISNRIYFHK